MEKIKLEIEVETNEESRVSATTLSNYILRAIAGVSGTNKAVVTSYNCLQRKREEKEERENVYMSKVQE